MDQYELKLLYDSFVESGELYDVMPDAKGTWEDDGHRFCAIQERLSTLIDDEEFNEELTHAGLTWDEFIEDLFGTNSDVDEDLWMEFE